MEMEVKKKGLLERFLRGVEVLGNKIPNPMLLFISLCIIVVLASMTAGGLTGILSLKKGDGICTGS